MTRRMSTMEEQARYNARSIRDGTYRWPWWYWRTWNYAKGSGSWIEAVRTSWSLWRFYRRVPPE